eukprot:gene8744-9637_t
MHLIFFYLLCFYWLKTVSCFQSIPCQAWLRQAGSYKASSTQLHSNIFQNMIGQLRKFEADKEESRKLRRTVFTSSDWRRHRSSDRYFRELMKTPKSIVLRSLTSQALAVALLSSVIVGYNMLIEARYFPWPMPLLTFPPLPFTLTSPSLGLLLVFRTNAAYSRWKDSRIYWAAISSKSFDLMRQTLAWISDPIQIATIFRHIVAFSRTLKWHLGGRTNEKRLTDDLAGVLTSAEMQNLLKAKHKPLYVLTHLTSLIAHQNLIPNLQSHMDRALIDLSMSMENCDRIYTTPIPLVYTRLTARFLLLWLLTFPMSLYREFSGRMKWVVPVISFLNSMFLFGIEDLGVQIEEPFSILPLANICYNIQTSGQSLLEERNIEWFHGTQKSDKSASTREKYSPTSDAQEVPANSEQGILESQESKVD